MKPIEGMISARQLAIIIALSRIPVLGVFMPVMTLADARQDAWFSAIMAVGGGIILGGMAALLAMRFPYQSLGSLAKISLGKYLGVGAALIFGLYFYLLSLSRARELSLLIVSTILPNTPGWVFGVTILIAALYGVLLGADTLGRSAEMLLTIVVITIFSGFVLLFISGTEGISLLRPVLSRGIQPVAVAAVHPSFEFANSAATVLALGKFCRRPGGMSRAVTAAILFSGFVKISLVVVVLITLGPLEAQQQLSPMLTVARTVYIPGIFERIDLLLVSIWVLGVIFEVTLYFFAASVVLADGLGLTRGKLAVPLFFIGLIPVSLRFIDLFDFIQFWGPLSTGIIILTIHIFLVGLVLIVSVLRGKGGKNENA